MSPVIDEKIAALADILSVEVSEIEVENNEYCVDNKAYYDFISEDEYDEVLNCETDNMLDSIQYDLSCSDFSYLEGYINWDRFINDCDYGLIDFGWEEYKVNDKYYYIREL